MDQTRAAGPDQVKVGLGRSNMVVALAVTGFLGWVIWAAGHGAWRSDNTSAKVLGFGIAAIFAIPLVMMLRALPRFLSPRYVVFDAVGILHGRDQVIVPWQEVRAIGIACEQAPKEKPVLPTSIEVAKDAVNTYLADKAEEALQVSGKRRIAFEIFPVRPEAVDQFPKLKPYWQRQQQPPAAGLPGQFWRFPLPPVVSIAQAIAAGGERFQPERWLGWVARPWSEPTR